MFNPGFKSLLPVLYLNVCKNVIHNLCISLSEKVISKQSAAGKVDRIINKLQDLLAIKRSLAAEIVKHNINLMPKTRVTEAVVDKNYNLCKNQQISNDTLMKYPSILYDSKFEKKLNVLKGTKDLNCSAPLLLLSNEALDNIVNKHGIKGLEDRIKYLCDKFNITPAAAYDAMLKKPFLRHILIKTVERNTQLLKERGITLEDIVRDFWVLRYSSKCITNRFDRAEEEDVEKLKTWMVRGKEEIFDAYIKRKTENKQILGNNSLAEYLMQRLNCTFGEAVSMINRIPAIRKKSMRKLREIIDFIYSEGFTAQHIFRVPKILLHSVTTSRKRLRELEGLLADHKLDSVHILTKSQRQYMQYYEVVKEKANKQKNTDKTSIVVEEKGAVIYGKMQT